jgi:hypothetical protein
MRPNCLGHKMLRTPPCRRAFPATFMGARIFFRGQLHRGGSRSDPWPPLARRFRWRIGPDEASDPVLRLPLPEVRAPLKARLANTAGEIGLQASREEPACGGMSVAQCGGPPEDLRKDRCERELAVLPHGDRQDPESRLHGHLAGVGEPPAAAPRAAQAPSEIHQNGPDPLVLPGAPGALGNELTLRQDNSSFTGPSDVSLSGEAGGGKAQVKAFFRAALEDCPEAETCDETEFAKCQANNRRPAWTPSRCPMPRWRPMGSL